MAYSQLFGGRRLCHKNSANVTKPKRLIRINNSCWEHVLVRKVILKYEKSSISSDILHYKVMNISALIWHGAWSECMMIMWQPGNPLAEDTSQAVPKKLNWTCITLSSQTRVWAQDESTTDFLYQSFWYPCKLNAANSHFSCLIDKHTPKSALAPIRTPLWVIALYLNMK